MTTDKLSISSPWVAYMNQVKALFSGDPNVSVSLGSSADPTAMTLIITATDLTGAKAAAIEKLLPKNVSMGNVTLMINVVPGNSAEPSYAELVEAAFSGNSNFCGVVQPSSVIPTPPYVYGVFKNTTAQYYDDNLSKYQGYETVVMADLAAKLLTPPAGFTFSSQVDL